MALQRRVAVVGGGVAGIFAAVTLSRSGVDVTLYEKSAKLGGQVDTRNVHGVDSTHPNLMATFNDLKVELQPADMSYSVSVENSIEWSSRGLSGVFAQKSNALSPMFWRMLADVKRFAADVEAYLARTAVDMSATLQSFLQELRYTDAFTNYYLVPMCALIWSADPKAVLAFPAVFLLRFLKNHSLLAVGAVQRPQWLAVVGRSKTYVERLSAPLGERVRLSTAIDRVELLSPASASAPKVRVHDSKGNSADYHDVVFATHAPETLRMLQAGGAASAELQELLAKFRYQASELYLHSDTSLLPRDKSCWAAWNFMGAAKSPGGGVCCSYYLNPLQTLKTDEQLIVTLNPPRAPAANLTHDNWRAEHPVPTVESVRSLPRVEAAQGKHGLWFAGAWLGYGFHEDGAKSGLDVAHKVVGNRAWQTLAYVPPFQLNWSQWAARKLVVRQFDSAIQSGELELWERAGSVMRLGKVDLANARVRLVVTSPVFYTQLFQRGALGFADAWIDGHVTCSDLTGFLALIIRNRDRAGDADAAKGWQLLPRMMSSWHAWYTHRARSNTPEGSKKNISAHYDLSNALFATFLDETMTYSSAVFKSENETLYQAQVNKLEMLTAKAQVQREHHVLEIGSGWGSLAIHMARTRGCKVTSLTLSSEQMALAEQRAKEAGLSDKITFRLIDYRRFADEVKGQKFDRIVSCEMLEAVGHEFFGAFFKVLDRLLAKDGIVVIQTIAISDQRYAQYLKTADFIQERIFPGGCLPCISALTSAARDNSALGLQHLENFALHYARTLNMWQKTFLAKKSQLESLGFDTLFQRTWDYYFCYCEAGFKTQVLQLLHLVWVRPGDTPNFTPFTLADQLRVQTLETTA